jgi:hypothetical protein
MKGQSPRRRREWNGRPRICSFSWPLPAIRTTSPGLASRAPGEWRRRGPARRCIGRRSPSIRARSRPESPAAPRSGDCRWWPPQSRFPAGGQAHLRTLGAVAVAAAAEERNHALARLRRHLPGQNDQVAQRVVGVGVVHDHREGLARIDGWKRPGTGLRRGTDSTRSAKGRPAREQR